MSDVALLPRDAHWVVLRRRVSLAGCVLRSEGGAGGASGAGGVGVSGGMVKLSALPGDDHAASGPSVVALANPTASRKAGAAPAAKAPVAVAPAGVLVVQTPIRSTGLYVFSDLAAGDYLTGGCDERGLAIEAKRVTVPPPDRTRRPTLLAFDLLVGDSNSVSLAAPAHAVAAA